MIQGVQQVLEAEQRVERMLQKAYQDKEKLINEAKHKAIQLISQEQKKIDAEQEARIAKKKEEFAKERKRILDEGKAAIHEIEKKAEKNVPKSVSFILKEFEQRVSP